MCLTFTGYCDYLNGRHVISNYKTSFSEYISIEKISEMVINENIRDTTILISEIQVYLNSLGSDSEVIKDFIGSVVGQSRKRNTDVHYDTQRYGDVHPRLRVQTDRGYIPQKFHYDGQPCSIDRCPEKHIIYLYMHDPFEPEPIVHLKADAFAGLYNSDEITAIPPKRERKKRTKKEESIAA